MRVMQRSIVGIMMFLVMLGSVAALGINFTDPCYVNTPSVTIFFSNDTVLTLTDFGVQNDCNDANSVYWGNVDLSALGDIVDGEVEIGKSYIYVDSVARPDLDIPAILTFNRIQFAVEPSVLKDGVPCTGCNVSISGGTIYVEVSGFSNYSLTGSKDFIVYSDAAPELDNKVYQTIDLGDARRGEEYACLVQIFGQSAENPGQWVLVQTNPQREVQGKMLGNPDSNQPESLGYFKTTGGMANVYFREQNIPGYNDFEYVVQCTSNSTKLIYEEPISTRYHPMGRNLVARGVWFADGSNAFYIIIGVVLIVLTLLLSVKAFKTWFGR